MMATQPDGIPGYEIVSGAGNTAPWITMVHGAAQNSAVFSAQIPAFQDRYRLLLIDLPGHGKSSSLPGPYGAEEYSASVLAAMDDAGVEETHFWGTHTGAGIALLLATRHLQRFASLILESAVLAGHDMPSINASYGRAKETARQSGMEAARRQWIAEGEWFRVLHQHPLETRAAEHWTMIDAFGGAPWLDRSTPKTPEPIESKLSQIKRPVLLINGEHDVVDFVRVADKLEAKLPDVQRLVIPGAGGFPLWEYPDVVNAAVLRFLEK
jgi:pimeloyl-ACP methyl ester carboxylesterase